MNKEAIKATALCRFDDAENVYIVESPLLDICMGAADTEKEAWAIFYDLLSAMYVEYLEGKIVGQHKRRGRPAKGGVSFHTALKPATKDAISVLADSLGCSQGEVIDYLVAYRAAHERMPRTKDDATRRGR